MQTSDRVVARRYAKAFFESVKPDAAARLRRDLSGSIKSLRDKQSVLRHPLLPVSEKAKVLHKVLGDQVGSETLRFLELLIKRKRFELLPYVSAEFERIADEETKVARAHVRVAHPLGEHAQAELEKKLAKYLGRTVVLDVKVDAALIGGIVVKVGDKVLDASASRGLERLKEKLLAA